MDPPSLNSLSHLFLFFCLLDSKPSAVSSSPTAERHQTLARTASPVHYSTCPPARPPPHLPRNMRCRARTYSTTWSPPHPSTGAEHPMPPQAQPKASPSAHADDTQAAARAACTAWLAPWKGERARVRCGRVATTPSPRERARAEGWGGHGRMPDGVGLAGKEKQIPAAGSS